MLEVRMHKYIIVSNYQFKLHSKVNNNILGSNLYSCLVKNKYIPTPVVRTKLYKYTFNRQF